MFSPRLTALALSAIVLAGCGQTPSSPVAPSQLGLVPQSLALGAAAAPLPVGMSYQLAAIGTYSNGTRRDVTRETTWRTSDDTIVDVTPDGLVTALAVGEAQITGSWNSYSESVVVAAARRTVPVPVVGQLLDYRTRVGVRGTTVLLVSRDRATAGAAETDAAGSYSASVDAAGWFEATVDGGSIGMIRIPWTGFRGDLFVNTAGCAARYGQVTDARTMRPVGGATVSLYWHTTTTGADGWYMLPFGCETDTISINTTFITVTHSDYARRDVLVGKGLARVRRMDIDLRRP